MKKYLYALLVLISTIGIVSAASPLDGKVTQNMNFGTIAVSVVVFFASLAIIKITGGVSAISIVLNGISALMMFYVAMVYNSGVLVEIMPDSTIVPVYNNALSQLWQFFAIVAMGLTFLQVVMLVFSKKKPLFVDERFGDGL